MICVNMGASDDRWHQGTSFLSIVLITGNIITIVSEPFCIHLQTFSTCRSLVHCFRAMRCTIFPPLWDIVEAIPHLHTCATTCIAMYFIAFFIAWTPGIEILWGSLLAPMKKKLVKAVSFGNLGLNTTCRKLRSVMIKAVLHWRSFGVADPSANCTMVTKIFSGIS